MFSGFLLAVFIWAVFFPGAGGVWGVCVVGVCEEALSKTLQYKCSCFQQKTNLCVGMGRKYVFSGTESSWYPL